MIDSLPQNQTLTKLNRCYYGKFVPQNLLIEVLNQFSDEGTMLEAFETIVAIFDRNVLHAVMSYLPDHESKVAFLELIRDEYNSSHPIQWATLQFDNAQQVITESIERTLLALHSALKEQR